MKKKLNGFTLTVMLKNKSRGIPIAWRYCISNIIALQIQGWKWRFGSFFRNYSISKYQETENYAVIMHSHFSEFNDNAETLSYVTVDNGSCVTTKLRQNLKVTTFLSAFLGSLLSMTMMYRLGKATQSAILFIYVAIVFVLGI